MNVLVPFADESDRAAFAQVAAATGHRFHFVDADFSHWRPSPDFNSAAYLARCLDVARRERVEAVLSTHDLGDLVAAIVARELGLPGPTPEAVFLCLHKHYGRQRESNPVRSEVLDLDDMDDGQAAARIAETIGFPCYVKPPWLKIGLLGFRLDGPADLAPALALARRDLPLWARQYRPLFEAAIDVARYPLVGRDILLVEEFVDGPQVTVEGFLFRGEFHLWAITDTNPCVGSRAIDNFSLPTRHSETTQRDLARAAEEIARDVGFDDGFFNAEFWCLPQDGSTELRLIEINGRAAACFSELYRGCLDVSHLSALVDLAAGTFPRALPRPNGRVGGQFNLLSFGRGRTCEFLDFEAAREFPEVVPFREPDEEIELVSEFGTVLGQFELFGASYEEIHSRAEGIRGRLLRMG